MYTSFFALKEPPFSIVPNARYLYLSARHQEAITHLQAGLGSGGGFALLTGEVGTGKTTVAKALLAKLGSHMQTALLLNPTFSSADLLEAICDAFTIYYPEGASLKQLHKAIYQFLLSSHAQGKQTLLVIDEAQHLSADVLEQLRLLTNLETDEHKLLKVMLVGQPELQTLLRTTQLRQLAQRITGRYHLLPLDSQETTDYIAFRMKLAGASRELFDPKMCRMIAKYSHGIPRLINLICDGALLRSYRIGEKNLSQSGVKEACESVMAGQAEVYQRAAIQLRVPPALAHSWRSGAMFGAASALGILLAWGIVQQGSGWLMSLDPPATAVEVSAEPLMLSHLERAQLLQRNSQENALAQLYQTWGYQSSVQDRLCLAEGRSIFECERYRTDWPTLLEHNRPVVLKLSDRQDTAYVVLYQIQGDQAVLLNQQSSLTLPVEVLQRFWLGEVVEIWQAPLRDVLKPNMQGEAIKVLDSLLARALDEPPLGVERYDAALKERVELFQRWQSMGVDGIAGRQTLTRLQQLVQPEAPSLRALGQGE